MPNIIKAITGNPKWIAGMICIAAAISVIIFGYVKMNDTEQIVTEDVQIQTVDMSQSVTAAGEVVTAEEEKIYFSTSKYFRAMCVEENEKVSEGQHLILYSDGTYEDAPADGFITAINAPATGSVGGTSYYITFAYADKLVVDITVPEGEINSVSKGDEAEIVVNSDTSKIFTGRITGMKAISTTLMSSSGSSGSSGSSSAGAGNGQSGDNESSPFGSDSSTAYYTVSLAFDNDGTILPGMSAICTITISRKSDIMAVPVEAVQFDDEGSAYVLVVEGSGTEKVSVKTGDSDADYVEITDGLDGDETVRIERKG